MTLTFYASVAKGLKLRVRKFCGLNPTLLEVTEPKLVGGIVWLSSPNPIWIGSKTYLKKTALDKILRDKAFDIAENLKHDGYQRDVLSTLYNFFDKQ